MKYLHTMIRISDEKLALEFFCGALGMVEISRKEITQGRFTLIFLAAAQDAERARSEDAPLLELTYNWPDSGTESEDYQGGRNFGHLAYAVDNIYETCQKIMDAGVTINRPPRDGYMAFLKSPEGISIELLQKGERLKPQEPWASMENTGSW